MKRLGYILIFVLCFMVLFGITSFAQETNLALEADVSTNSSHWGIIGTSWLGSSIPNLTDQDPSTGVISCPLTETVIHTFKLKEAANISKITILCNGSGDVGFFGELTDINYDTNYTVTLYGANDEELYSETVNAFNKTKISVLPDISAPVFKITVDFVSGFSQEAAFIREVEIYGSSAPSHTCEYSEFVSISYEKGFLANGSLSYKCNGCDSVNTIETAPLFNVIGYSIKEDFTGITCDFNVNKKAINNYCTLSKTDIEYGIVLASGALVIEENSLFDEFGNISNDKFIKVEISKDYSLLSVSIQGFPNDFSYLDMELVLGIYVNVNGSISLLQSDVCCQTIIDDLKTISMRKIAEIVNINGEFDNILALPPKSKESIL